MNKTLIAVVVLLLIAVTIFLAIDNNAKKEKLADCNKFCRVMAIEFDSKFINYTEDGKCICDDGSVGLPPQ